MQPARRAGGQTRQNGRAGSGETRCARQPSARADGANGAAQYEVQTTARMISRTYSLNDPSYGHAVVIFIARMRLRVLVRHLVAPVLTGAPAARALDHAAVVGRIRPLEALGVPTEAIGAVEAAALCVACLVALAVVDERGHAVVGARRLPPVEAVALIPVAFGVEARTIAVAIADPR